ncbi:MAG: TM0106 family RecB-like putative nuclease, partial [Acidimicrobiales bacterium]
MESIDGQLVLSPTDLVGFLYCEHLTDLSVRAARHELAEPEGEDPDLAVLARRGMEHEVRHRDALLAAGREVVEVVEGELADKVGETAAALGSGVDVVYQGAFYHPGPPPWRGYADFLVRVEEPSELGPFSYEPQDAKLAHSVR